MTDKSFETLKRVSVSLVAALVIFLYICSPTINASNNVDDEKIYFRSLANNETKHESILPHFNITSVTGWVKSHKKQAAIGLIVGVTITIIIVILICCCVSKVASEKAKRKKKKKDAVERGYSKKVKLPKFKLPKFPAFRIQPSGIENIGKLVFSLFYEMETKTLYVKIIKAEDLSIKSSGYVSFSFVHIVLNPMSASRETKRVRNCISPVFNDLTVFNVKPDELKEQTLILCVFDENKTSPRDLIGSIRLDMRDEFDCINETSKQYTPSLQWRKEAKGGDIYLGFYWHPREEIFYVTVKECSDLTPVDKNGQANPYVTLDVFDGTTRILHKKTPTKQKTLFPDFGEGSRFYFPFKGTQKKSLCLIISVKHRPSWRSGKKEVIGQLSFSSRSIGSEQRHWQSALTSGTTIFMKHGLHSSVDIPGKHASKRSQCEDLFDDLSEEENLVDQEEDLPL